MRTAVTAVTRRVLLLATALVPATLCAAGCPPNAFDDVVACCACLNNNSPDGDDLTGELPPQRGELNCQPGTADADTENDACGLQAEEALDGNGKIGVAEQAC